MLITGIYKRINIMENNQSHEKEEISYPPKAQSKKTLHHLQLFSDEKTKRKSKHKVYIGREDSPNQKDKKIFLKMGASDINVRLEAYFTAVNRLIATSKYVPSANEIYDEQGVSVGVKTTAWKDFQSYHEKPLKPEDIALDNPSIIYEQSLNTLLKQIDIFLKTSAENTVETQGFLNYKKLKATFNSLFAGNLEMSAEDFKNVLIAFKNDSYHHDDIAKLIKIVLERKKSLEKQDRENSSEFSAIQELELLAKKANKNRKKITKEDFTIADYIAFDRKVSETNINLDDHEIIALTLAGQKRCMPSLELKKFRKIRDITICTTTRRLTKEVDLNSGNFDINGRMIDFDKNKFDFIKGYIELSFIEKMSMPEKKDFAFTEETVRNLPDINTKPILYWPTKQKEYTDLFFKWFILFLEHTADLPFENDDVIKSIIYTAIDSLSTAITAIAPKEDALTHLNTLNQAMQDLYIKIKSYILNATGKEALTEEDRKLIFLEIKNQAMQFYQTHRNKINLIEENIKKLLRNNNDFTKEDNELIKSLATHPIAIYFRLQTCLKYILTDEEVYRCLTNLYIIPQNCSKTENKENNFHLFNMQQRLIENEIENIKEVTNALVRMPEFKKFLEMYGDVSFKIIANEFAKLANDKHKKIPQNELYTDFIAAISLSKIKDKFKSIEVSCRNNFDESQRIKYRKMG